MKVLITGHLGFIGKRLTALLDAEGIEWVGFDIREDKPNDIRDFALLEDAFAENSPITHCVHLAALAGVRTGQEHPRQYIDTNINGTFNVMEACKLHNVHLVSFSSSSVVGNQPSPNKETDALLPIAVYGITKASAEQIVKNLYQNATIIRPFTVYGEDGRKDQLFFKWIEQIKAGEPVTFYGDGTTKRGYTYVGDLVLGVLQVLRTRENTKEVAVYNLGGEEIITLNEVLELFQQLVPNLQVDRQELPFADVRENWADLTKAKTELGFNPQTKFKEKVLEIINAELKII